MKVNTNILLASVAIILVIGIVVMAIMGTAIPNLISQLATLTFGGLFGYAVQGNQTTKSSSTSTNSGNSGSVVSSS